MQRVDQRVQPGGGLRRSGCAQLGFAQPGSSTSFSGSSAQALGGLREAAAEHAQQIEDLLVGDAGLARDVDHPRADSTSASV